MKTLLSRSAGARRGFSLIELVITMTIMAILVGVVSMRASGATEKARAAQIHSIVEKLEPACAMYHKDTGALAYEYSGYQGATYHRLSLDPGVTGWSGPYIEGPINRSWSPTGSTIHLYSYVVGGYTNNNGIDLDGNGTADVTGSKGNLLVVWGVTEKVAQYVDRAVDRELPGDWSDAGRVEYERGSQRLSVLVYRD